MLTCTEEGIGRLKIEISNLRTLYSVLVVRNESFMSFIASKMFITSITLFVFSLPQMTLAGCNITHPTHQLQVKAARTAMQTRQSTQQQTHVSTNTQFFLSVCFACFIAYLGVLI